MSELSNKQRETLVSLCKMAMVYKLRKIEDLLVACGLQEEGSKIEASKLRKKIAACYVTKTAFEPSINSSFLNAPSFPANRLTDKPMAEGNDANSALEQSLLGDDGNNVSESEISDTILALKGIIEKAAQSFYRMTLTDPESLKIVREGLKIISSRIADIPIDPAIETIDHYLDKYEKQGKEWEKAQKGSPKPNPNPSPNPSPNSNTPPPPGQPGTNMEQSTGDMNDRKNLPPWAQ